MADWEQCDAETYMTHPSETAMDKGKSLHGNSGNSIFVPVCACVRVTLTYVCVCLRKVSEQESFSRVGHFLTIHTLPNWRETNIHRCFAGMGHNKNDFPLFPKREGAWR